MALFGTNGVRGRLDALTPALAFGLCASFASWSKGQAIVLARDMRLTSPMLHSAAASGIMAAGKDVLDIGLASSPVAEFTLAQQKAGGLVIVTASHNAPEWNALKFVDGEGVAVSRERGELIGQTALARTYCLAGWQSVGKARPIPEAAAVHARAVQGGVAAAKIRKRHLRIALDFGNGTSALSQGVFSSLGCEVFALNESIDGNFPGRPSEPTEANVQQLAKTVKAEGCDLGVAWDGDSDRVVFVDEKGSWIVGDKGFAISAVQACREAKKQKEKLIVTTVATSRCVEEACAALGAKTVYTAVGAPYLSEKMAALGARAVSGGEEVGGIIWPRFSLAKDGLFASAKICEMACRTPLSELVSELPEYFNSKTKIEAKGAQAKAAGLNAAKAHARGSGARLTLADGVRCDFDDGWVIARASGTEDCMRVFAEGKTKKRAEGLMEEYAEIVREAAGKA
ncbi:MAG: phosphoglucosamine mutase [Candidatus Micrarchaeota archaeon]|nr:phosphoglucosamine mutase [Candidatus Micrarchaeota archaeon]